MFDVLIAILDRLRFIPGLGFLHSLRAQVLERQRNVQLYANKIHKMKKLADHNVKSVRELPSVIKGSKKRT